MFWTRSRDEHYLFFSMYFLDLLGFFPCKLTDGENVPYTLMKEQYPPMFFFRPINANFLAGNNTGLSSRRFLTIYTFVPEAPGGFIQIKENITHISTVPYSVLSINQLAEITKFLT